MTKAFKAPLTITQQQTLYSAMAADPKIVNHTGLTPAKVCLLKNFHSSLFYLTFDY